METLITLAVVVLVTAIAVAGHLRRSRRAAARHGGGREVPALRGGVRPEAARCPACGVPRQIFEVVGSAGRVDRGGRRGRRQGARHRARRRLRGLRHVRARLPGAGRDPHGGQARGRRSGHVRRRGRVRRGVPGRRHRPRRPAARCTASRCPTWAPTSSPTCAACTIAGELGGRGLIKNAINEGRIAAENVARDLGRLARGSGSAARDDDRSLRRRDRRLRAGRPQRGPRGAPARPALRDPRAGLARGLDPQVPAAQAAPRRAGPRAALRRPVGRGRLARRRCSRSGRRSSRAPGSASAPGRASSAVAREGGIFRADRRRAGACGRAA